MEKFLPWAGALAAADEPVIMGGDFNIAHTPADIHNPSGNKRNSGFLPHEREWFSGLLDCGFADLIRRDAPGEQGPYSWWSNRGRARELDRGWRIDYLLANSSASKMVTATNTLRDGGLVVSDHAPVSVDLEFS